MKPEDYNAGTGQVEPIPAAPPADEWEEREMKRWAQWIELFNSWGKPPK